jgi:hypothetical protein
MFYHFSYYLLLSAFLVSCNQKSSQIETLNNLQTTTYAKDSIPPPPVIETGCYCGPPGAVPPETYPSEDASFLLGNDSLTRMLLSNKEIADCFTSKKLPSYFGNDYVMNLALVIDKKGKIKEIDLRNYDFYYDCMPLLDKFMQKLPKFKPAYHIKNKKKKYKEGRVYLEVNYPKKK